MKAARTLQERMDDYLREHGVTPQYAQEAGLFAAPAADVRKLGSPHAHDAIVIPYPHPFHRKMVHAELIRFRYLSDPLPINKDGKEVRYAQPKGSPVEAYFDPHIDWKTVAKDTSVALHFIEGEIKALALNQAGYVTIGLGGVDSFGGQDLTEWLRAVLL